MFKEFFDGSLRAVSTVVLVLLAVTVLILPPFNLPARLGLELGLPDLGDNRAHIDSQGGLTTDETRGIAVIFLPEDMTVDASVVLTGVPMDNLGNMRGDAARFQAGVDALGMVGLKAKSSLFLIDFRGSDSQRATIQMPIPEVITAFERLKLVTWRDGRWQTVPSTIVRSALQIESRLDHVPDNLLLVQDDISLLPDLTLLMDADQLPAPGTAHEVVDRVGVAFSTLRGDGGLEGEIAPIDTSSKPVLLGIGNTEANGTVRADLLINMLSSGGQLQNQSISILDAVREFGFHGVYLNYGGLSLQPGAGPNFTAFAAGLAAELKADDPTRRLIVQVEAPRQVSEAEWNTLGYDWAGLAEFADQVVVPAPLEPEDFRPGSYPFESLLMYATGRIPRSKLTIALHADSVGVSDTQLAMMPFSSAIDLMKGSLAVDAVGDNLMMQLDRSTLAEEPRYDPILHQYTLPPGVVPGRCMWAMPRPCAPNSASWPDTTSRTWSWTYRTTWTSTRRFGTPWPSSSRPRPNWWRPLPSTAWSSTSRSPVRPRPTFGLRSTKPARRSRWRKPVPIRWKPSLPSTASDFPAPTPGP